MLKKILSFSAACVLFSLQASANIRNYIPSYQIAEESGILERAVKSIKNLLPSSNNSSQKQSPAQDIPSSHQVINPEDSTEKAQKDTAPVSNPAVGNETQNETTIPVTSLPAPAPLVDHPAIPAVTPETTTPADDSTSHLQPAHPEQTNVQPTAVPSEDVSTHQSSNPATEGSPMPISVVPLTSTQDSTPADKTNKSSTEETTTPPAEASQEVK